jgi:outer membrane protein assembly factor BamD
MIRRPPVRLLAVVVALAALACSSGGKVDPIAILSSAEALELGKQLMAEEKYRQARDYLIHAFEVEPNSVGGREALLLSADCYYLQGGADNYLRAESKYRDFQTRFPTSDRAAYVQFQIANSLGKRILRPDRDQSSTRKALEEYRAVIELYPTSEFVAEAERQIEQMRQSLASHEMIVGYFYMRYGNLNGATSRLEYVLENFPDFEQTDRVLFYLGMTYRRSDREEESRQTFERLAEEYPDSPFVRQIPDPRPTEEA